jgi:quercetin dioxygenase-like cupin family protein
MRALILTTILALSVTGTALAQEHAQAVASDAVEFKAGPSALPKGAQWAVLAGDPSKPGPYVIRLKFPAGFKVAPHFHPNHEAVTVIAGEFNLGQGDKLDEKSAQKLSQGGFIDVPANHHHYAFTTADTVIQINSEGPSGITYVNPADDPRKSQ